LSGSRVVAIDQGTTGSTVVVLDAGLRVLAKENREFPQHYPEPGWVEHDPEAIWESVLAALAGALDAAKCDPKDVCAIGITNQRETTIVWDRKTGAPVHPAIVWQDRRTADRCAALKAAGREPFFRERTGLVLDPYFSGTKIAWILDEVPGARARAEAGELAFGTVDSFLVSRLTGGGAHVTDASNASRTLLFDLRPGQGRWSEELSSVLGVPRALLPEVKDSAEVVGRTKGVRGLPDGIPIAGIAGDQQAALFGQACFEPGDAKCTFGTGAFLVVHTGDRPVPSQHGLLTTVAWRIGGKLEYALEGSAFIAGAAVQWLRDGLGLIRSAAEIEALAKTVSDAGGLVFVPALVGLGAPHWDPAARGLLCGITRGTTAAHVARATLDGIAHQVADLLGAIARDTGRPLGSLRVDGGATANDLLLQIQADLAGIEVVRPEVIETTAVGAALLAGLATGLWRSKEEIRKVWRAERVFRPEMQLDTRERQRVGWRRAVERARGD
jgi:glycerol kinase